MPGQWEFNKADPSSVRVEVTQRDQFNNDDVGLAEALVREAIQNSTDARSGNGPVRVKFGIKVLNRNESEELERNFTALTPHLAVCGLHHPKYSDKGIKVLCIEDFGTSGLTGSFEARGSGHFDKFWRAVGESEKSGKMGGRWGLGKLVYSSASQIRSFFGLTVRDDDAGPSIMGQAVLSSHIIGEKFYTAHGFWFDRRSPDHLRLHLPVTDLAEIEALSSLFGVQRTTQPGLSVIVPYLIEEIDEEDILSGIVNHFYFPILAGDLEVEVGDKIIDAGSFDDVVNSISHQNHQVPFSFVKKISRKIGADPSFRTDAPIGDSRLIGDCFSDDKIEKMKNVFSTGELVHLEVTVNLKPRSSLDKVDRFDLFIEMPAERENPFALFARGQNVLVDERRYFTGVAARGAIIASDGAVAAFLGDAENPAHTGLNPRAEKLRLGWRNPQRTLAAIRHSLRDLYGMIADQEETQDDDALIDFFSLAEKSQAKNSRKKKKRASDQDIDIPPRPKAIRINPRKGGFQLVAGPDAEHWKFPRRIRIRIAYDTIGADPYRRFSRFDFDLNKFHEKNFKVDNGRKRIVRANALYFDVDGPAFSLSVDGFDIRRDLVVDARALP